MAAAKYVRPSGGTEQRRVTEEGGAHADNDADQRRGTEEGGGTAFDMGASVVENVVVLNKESTASSSLAVIRLARRREQRAAKQQRAARAEQRRMAQPIGGAQEVDVVVAAMDIERRTRREQQCREARDELARRQQEPDVERPQDGGDERAQVRLAQRRIVPTDTESTDNETGFGVLAEDGLPTATMDVEGERLPVKLDSGARYSVTGTDWMMRGERVSRRAPVDVVEGIGGFVLKVVGMWRFDMRNAFGQMVTLEACIIEGCTDEFLVGVDFLQRHKAVMDYERNEVRYDERRGQVVIPFRTDGEGTDVKVAAVRLVGRARLARSAVTPVEVAVAAPDGEEGIFIPTTIHGSVMMAATVTTSRHGKARVPLINAQGGRRKLPSKKELGRWIPLEKDIPVLVMSGATDRDKLDEWLRELGDTETSLDNEGEVRVGEEEPEARAMVIRLLRAYRDVSKDKGDCPPMTALNVQHHIDTGKAAPIMMKRHRHEQMEDATIESNVSKMLGAGVIEEGNGA
ncbi:hypothetical protein PR003_g13545 [Phytophthora rubi]|uniref:Peptidase A2 domain-containing protein n=1 Tax=Phytophthora rubi TaxID=129364 RepID=A0A6A3MSV0_9STRA|nr:hypothetical protein PR002_g12764 [Phytophthora rubi]KAE9031894.1 hypothetical protein PR001_g10852 [Phytophthora rubi]KAE9334393.1 hypothetical protein PR003_g13545 [Phytophthora rubi]